VSRWRGKLCQLSAPLHANESPTVFYGGNTRGVLVQRFYTAALGLLFHRGLLAKYASFSGLLH